MTTSAFQASLQDFYTRVKADYLRRILEAKGKTSTLDVLDIGCGHGLDRSGSEW